MKFRKGKQSPYNFKDWNYVPVWIQIIMASVFLFCSFLFFFFGSARICWFFHSKQCIRVLFTDPQIPLFNNFFIKNRSHDTIHTFKNDFITVFSVSIFSFNKNKLNPNESYIFYLIVIVICALRHKFIRSL